MTLSELPEIRTADLRITLAPSPVRSARIQLFSEVTSTSRRGIEVDVVEPVRWRLLTANHRCLAVGSGALPGSDQARAAATDVVRRAAQLSPRASRDDANRWWWSVRLDGVEVARSARGYHRRIECDLALRQFVQLVAEATVYPTVLRFRRAGEAR